MIVAVGAALILTLTPGHVARVINGDTFVLYHVGIPPEEHVQLLGVDCPEGTSEAAKAARAMTDRWLRLGVFQLRTHGRDKYGRLLADVWRTRAGAEDHLAQGLVAQGLCQPRSS
jgi:endonuclease YncB( thermonuclease family)